MKRLVGIACCLLLLLASAAWALEKCQSLVAHHGAHEHSEEVSHSHSFDVARDQSLPGNPVIHCADTREIPSFIPAPPSRLNRSTVAYAILPASFIAVMADANASITHGMTKPPGSFLSAVAFYISLSVLRI